ncbi:MAG: cytidylate kinase-like family protein [Succinivibrio sp.]|jgi:cytidylate kinase|nr:cytidylate kinase-like family protein [Succinivibrio sp.]MBQ8477667.1 cytidylate kinase-like family protein [Succinivibrio sp.]MCI5576345.1 cytidylate kinase-like family protein [Succinivibrio sp.]MCI5638058.1 cytidylate kinase-like family protein [Succinivibrio sp.]MCI7773112.1 cytidylate kinase-like family protein [Succinivibrio sp.]
MSNYVITISRQFASMGRTIGLKMASNLNIELLDRDIVKEASKRLGLPKGEISHYDENPGRDSFFLRKTYLFDFSVYNIHNNVFEVQKNIIKDYAEKESCIIVGRCADSILRDHKNVLNICIYAPFEARLQNCINNLAMDEKTALESLKRVDEARSAYRKKYCPECTSEYDDRHLMIDSSYFGVDKTAQILTDIVKDHFHL